MHISLELCVLKYCIIDDGTEGIMLKLRIIILRLKLDNFSRSSWRLRISSFVQYIMIGIKNNVSDMP